MRALHIVGALLALGAALLLSGCTWAERAVFPEWGEVASLEGTFSCGYYDKEGVSTSSDPTTVTFHEVGGGEKGYKYYAFGSPSSSGEEKPEPISFSLHEIYRGFYVGQSIVSPTEVQYFWYGSVKNEFFYYEDESMKPDRERLAKEHDVALDPFTKEYYVALHGEDEDIRAYLLELGPLYQGGIMRCEPI